MSSWERSTRPGARSRRRSGPIPATTSTTPPTAQGYYDYFNGVGQRYGRAGDRQLGYYSFDLTKGLAPDLAELQLHRRRQRRSEHHHAGQLPAGLAPGALAAGRHSGPPQRLHHRPVAPRLLLVGTEPGHTQRQRDPGLLAGPVRLPRHTGVQRPRPRLRAVRTPGRNRSARSRPRRARVRGRHRRQEPVRAQVAGTQQRGVQQHNLRCAQADAAPPQLRLAVRAGANRNLRAAPFTDQGSAACNTPAAERTGDQSGDAKDSSGRRHGWARRSGRQQ